MGTPRWKNDEFAPASVLFGHFFVAMQQIIVERLQSLWPGVENSHSPKRPEAN
jgi:hypothetical protein